MHKTVGFGNKVPSRLWQVLDGQAADLVPLLRRPLGPVCNPANGGLDPVAT